MILIGITGILGSGKSTLSGILKEEGFFVIDLDAFAHRAVSDSAVVEEVEREFGKGFITGGTLNREKMRDLVFENKERLKKLEEIIHPAVRAALFREVEEQARQGRREVLVDGPLLYETGLYKSLDKIVVVTADMPTIKERVKRRGLTEDDIERRLTFQIPLSEKEKMADYIVHNNGDKQQLRSEADKLIKMIKTWEEQ